MNNYGDSSPFFCPDTIIKFFNNCIWTASYFVATCGGVTIEQLKKYVEKQQSPAL